MTAYDFAEIERDYDTQAVERHNEIDDERHGKQFAETLAGEHHDPITDTICRSFEQAVAAVDDEVTTRLARALDVLKEIV